MVRDTKRKANRPNPPQHEAGPLVYVGPTLWGKLHLVKHTVFRRGRLPEPLAAAVRQEPALARLLVPVQALAGARQELAEADSPLARTAQQVVRRFARGGADRDTKE